jgi:cell division protein FtsB
MSTAAPPVRTGGTGLRLSPGAALLILAVVALLISTVVPLRTYLAQRDRLSRLEHSTVVLEGRNAELQAEIEQLRDPAHIEQVARCLGMIRPGEISFVVVPDQGVGAAAPDC